MYPFIHLVIGELQHTVGFWFIPDYLIPSVPALDISPHPLSDHSMVILEIKTDTAQKGPGSWRFDNTLLQDRAFIDRMTAFLLVSNIHIYLVSHKALHRGLPSSHGLVFPNH